MIEILQYYTSSFWVWAGITLGLGIVLKYATALVLGLTVGLVGAFKGARVQILCGKDEDSAQ